MVCSVRIAVAVLMLVGSYAVCPAPKAFAAKKEVYDIIYILSNDLERVLDYKEDLEGLFEPNVSKKMKIVGRGDEYGLIYDGNLSSHTVAKTLIEHAELLNTAGYDEPYAIKEQRYDPLYNVSYGIGPNLEPLKKKYQILYSRLGEEVKRDLFIEQTDFGNYVLVYRMRGDEASTNRVARKHAALLKSQKIKTSIVRENNNSVVYGESSLIDEGNVNEPEICLVPEASIPLALEKTPPADKKVKEPVEKLRLTAQQKIQKTVPSEFKNGSILRSIENHVANLKSKGLLDPEESIGWAVYDLQQDQNLLSINGDKDFQAASMIKPFVALAYFHMVNENKLTYNSQARGKMEAMIQRSSNPATNWAMKQVGGPAQCHALLKKHYGHLLKRTEIKEYIPADGRTYLNSAPPSDYVRFLRALWNQELPHSKEIRRLMALPKRDRIYYGTLIPQGTLKYNKTGSTARLCGDMGILVPKTKNGERYPYVVVGIIERKSRAANYGQWMNSRGRVLRQISTLVYEELKKEHQFL